jgi:hypothetical protein
MAYGQSTTTDLWELTDDSISIVSNISFRILYFDFKEC